jgi:hypothetical protein
MTEMLKTVCVGRYLVDVPAEAEVSLSGGMLGGFEISTREEGEVAFRERIEAREAEINANGSTAGSDGPGGMIKVRELPIPKMIGRTLIYGRTRSHGFAEGHKVASEYVSIETYAHVGSMSLTLFMKYANDADIRLSEALLARLQIKGADEVPTVPGFCMAHAVFAEPLPTHDNEHLVMHLHLPNHPDLALALFSIAGAKRGPGILSRVADVDAGASAEELLRVTKLRAGKRSINGMEGEELLERVREYNFATTYGFNWETRGAEDDTLQPYLSLELQTGISKRPGGKPVDSSLHEDALLALWDSIASSIRLRKNDPPPPSGLPPEPHGPKLGAVASAGEVCPQSGWWRCDAGEPGMDVHGGQVQYIRKGERMPQALLLPRQTLWQKFKRIQPSVESPSRTAWTLVDKRHRSRAGASVALAPAVAPPGSVDIADASARPVALGTHLRTGEICPANGWWRCEEPNALDGTRWFAQGSLFPAATFLVPAELFAKSAGPEVIQRRSAWQLMRYAETPASPQGSAPLLDGSHAGEPPAPV